MIIRFSVVFIVSFFVGNPVAKILKIGLNLTGYFDHNFIDLVNI